ncbi:hypothetical protein Zmor_004753 [Zophobas morio]|uniref:NACHT domain-containing protein n=1 Tax=Zophobas morio TaxID=2755281 RepID=A0AA38ILZ9_9CUCU|nr:hypothetical protein Zmor_004753 [Zophobas morio]
MAEIETFKQRPGVPNRGKEYEDMVLASVVLKLINDPAVKNVHVSSNEDKFGAFDDIVIKTQSYKENETRIKAVQLKHTDTKILTISEWSIQNGTKEKLNKNWVRLVLGLHLLDSQIEALSFGSVSDKMKIFRDSISLFDIALFETESCEIIKTLWGDVGKDKNFDFKELNNMRKRYLPRVKHITDDNIGDIDSKILSQLLWLMDKCPLILRKHENVEKCVQLCPEKKFILVGECTYEEWMKTYSVFQDLSNLNREPELRDTILQNFTISIQGKEELNLVTAFGDNGEFLKNVRTDDLLKMLHGPYRINGEKETLPEPYVERYLSRNIINITYLEKVHENTIIILNCANNFGVVKDKLDKCQLIDIDNFLQKTNHAVENLTNETTVVKSGSSKHAANFALNKASFANRNSVGNRKKIQYDQFNNDNKINLDKSKFAKTIYVSNRHYNDSELQQIYNEHNDIKQFHYFQLLSDGNLKWINSKGDVSEVEVYKLPDKYSIEENALWSSRLEDNNINLITGDPGMGKSELMKSFKNKCPPKYWTIIISPKDVNLFFHNSKFSRTNCAELFEKFMANEKYRSLKKLDRLFFEMCIKKNNVIYVWDALDEILNEHLDAVLNIIFDFSKKKFRQWVTSRRNLKTNLEKKFNLLSLSINQFGEQEQQDYIRKRLNTFISSDKIDITLEKIKSSFAIVAHIDILGVPLQIFMLTELFRQNSEKYLKLMENTFLLTDLYDYFIDEKFNNFYKHKIGYENPNPQQASRIREEQREILDLHERVSFKVIFDDEITQRLNIDFEKCIVKLQQHYASLGLVTDFQNNVPRFLHTSFAEYLIATYLHKNRTEFKDIISHTIFDAKYNNIRFFFDMLLAKNSKAHIAVLYKNYELLRTYDDNILTGKDEGGRSALHLISSWGQRHPCLKVTIVDGEHTVHEDSNFDGKTESKFYFETIAYLQRTNDVDERDILLNATPLFYATKSESLGAELKLLQVKKNGVYQSCSRDNMINIIFYSALFGYDDVCKHFTVEELKNFWYVVKIVTAENAETPLWLASQKGNLNIVEYFVRSGVEINCADNYGWTPLFVASRNGHEEVVEYLATVGAEINCADNDGWTPLHLASFKGHGKLVEYLATVGAEINGTIKNGTTPLHLASQDGHEKLVEYLATVGAEINRVDDNGLTPLHSASQNGHEKVVEYLVSVGAEINRADNKGWTPIYVASQQGHQNVVEYLATVGAEINSAMNDGWTPLHAASFNGHEKLVEYLTTAGAEINRATDDGWTPLKIASENGHQKVVEYLTTVGADINRTGNEGWTPLHVASQKGHQKVVEYLTTVGAELNRVETDGWTPLYVASFNGHEKVVEYLTTVGAEINRADTLGRTPLFVASQIGHEKVVECLIKVGAEINQADNDGRTPLDIACENGHEKITFTKRPGTTDRGKEYEDTVLSSLLLKLINDPTVKNFHVSSNEEKFGAFDDIVIKTESNTEHEIRVKAVQLKHTNTKTLTVQNLRSRSGPFSISKYFESFREIEADVHEFILFTNRPLVCKENEKFILQKEKFHIELIEAEDSLELSERSKVYQFRIAENPSTLLDFPIIEEYKTFLSKFYLYTDQHNLETMKNTTAYNFSKTYNSNEEIFDKFFRSISEWSIQDGKKEKLNKNWVQLVLTLHLLSSQTEPLSFGSVSDKMKIFRDSISLFDIALFEKESCDIVKTLWGDVGKEKNIDFEELNKIRKRYLPSVKDINDDNISDIDPKILSHLLWFMDESPLILRKHENVEKGIQLCPGKKFILVGECKYEEWMKTYSVFQNLSNLNSKPELRDTIMQNFTISIQGKEELNLVTAFGDNGEFLENVRTDDLIEMLNAPYPIDGEKETLPEPYVERYLSRNIVNFTYLEKVHENTIIIMNWANNFDIVKDKLDKCQLIDIDNFLQKKNHTAENLTNEACVLNSGPNRHTANFNLNKSSFANKEFVGHRKKIQYDEFNNENRIYLDKSKFGLTIYAGNRHYNNTELQQIYNEHNEIKQFHYFQLLSDGNLEWVKSLGDVSDVEVYKLPDKYSIEENTLWSSRLDNSINLIIGDPGMGKSELMKSFKNKCPPKFWTVIFNPKDVNFFFHNSKFSETNCAALFEKFITNEKCRPLRKLDRLFFEMCIKKNNVIYVWDALDEILNEHLDAVQNIILDLSTKNSRQWVTSRRNLKTTLEKKFNLLSLSMNQFSQQEQQDYIRKRLNNFISSDKIDITLEKIESSFAIVEHIDILGIPLQIFMLTELFRVNSEKYFKLMENTFLLTDLYDYSIDEKFNNYYKHKIGFDFENPHLASRIRQEKREILDLHESVSFIVIFDEKIMQQLNIDNEKCIEKLQQSYASLGLINDFQNNVPRFLHISFAEYLIATCLTKNVSEFKDIITDTIFHAKYDNVRFFFDMLIAKNSKAHIAVLYKNYELLRTYDDKILKGKDEGGRNALHLISSWGRRHPRVTLTVVNEEYIVHEANNFVEKPETEAYFETITYLQGKNDVRERDVLLETTPLTYAIRSESLGAELKLLQIKINELTKLCSTKDLINILFYCAKFGYEDVCKFFTVSELKNFWCKTKVVTAKGAKTLLLLACQNGNLNIVKDFVRCDATAHCTASPTRHKSVAEYLSTVDTEINRANNDGVTPLFVASLNGHQTVVEHLVTIGAEINRATNNGLTSLHIASVLGHEKVVKYLATKGAEINCAVYSCTALYMASQNGYKEVVEHLAREGADINRADNDGRTPLHIASSVGHEKVVEYLTTVGAEINCVDKDGCTPLLRASEKGHRKVVEHLATAGAEINHAANDDWTPLHVASQNNHQKVVEYLTRVGAEINRANKNGVTPLHLASLNGHEKVVEHLTTIGSEINRADNDGSTPLHDASQNGHQIVVEYLATVGAEINRVKNDGWTSLHVASFNGHHKVVEYLATVGAEINRAANDNVTPLHLASFNGHEKVVEYLVTNSCEINSTANDGWTPLHVASQNGHQNVVEFLTSVGAEINLANNDGSTPLFIASKNGHQKVVKHLATVGAEINRADNVGWTPLHIASEKGHQKVVECLTTVGAEINCALNDGWTPLHIASQNGHEKVVEYLATVGAEINHAVNGGHTALHVASKNGHAKVVEYVTKVGAEINRTNKYGATSLHAASESGHEKIVEYLATIGAEINRVDNNGWTPLHFACQNGHQNVVEYLKSVGAEINRAANGGFGLYYVASSAKEVVEYMTKVGAEINRATNDGVTSLYMASETGHQKVVEYLTTVSAEINRANQNGATPLYIASETGHEKVVEYLTSVGAEINRACSNGLTPLHIASQNGHQKVVECLTTVGAEINRACSNGLTPLYIASETGHEKVVECLTSVGAEINRACSNGLTPLHIASQNGHQKIVECLTKVGAEINRACSKGLTPLHIASQNGHQKVVECLTKVGAEINRADIDGWTPLHMASQNGPEKVVEYLTSVGAEINRACSNGLTPLHIASQNGHQKVVECLTRVGAEINRATNNGVTPLHAASFNGHEKVVEYLTSVGAEINRACSNGLTPLHIASQNGHQKVVECLTRVGVEINRATNNGVTPLYIASETGHEKVVEYLTSVGAEINRAYSNGLTPLHIASQNGHQKIVECLTKVGAEINRACSKGLTPLHIASQNGHQKVVECLTKVGAEINRADIDGWTPLHMASQNGPEKVVEYLTSVGAEINRACSNGLTPLHIASQNGHQKVVECLTRVGVEINRATNNGVTPLYIASETGHEKVVEYLTSVGAEINRAYSNGLTPLHIASQNGHQKIVECLTKVGAEINRACSKGLTPLHIASQNGHQKVVECLTKVGAEINRADIDGWTPLHMASQNGPEKVVEYLTSVGAEINRACSNGLTPLHIASQNGHQKVVECLTRVGVEINRATNNGVTPLYIASETGHEKVVEYLTSVGAEINRAYSNGLTPLHIASQNGHQKIVECLTKVGAEINRACSKGLTPLHIASQNGHQKVVECLTKVGAEINRADIDGWTPLHMASQNGPEKVVEYLTSVGAEINRACSNGLTPLHIASQNGHQKVVECLTRVGAEINRVTNDGATPLYIASETGHEKVVEYLTEVGAEINSATIHSVTPLYVASFKGHEKVVENLTKVDAKINHADSDGFTPLYVASLNGHEKVVEYLATVGAEINRATNDGATPLYVASSNGHEKIVEYLATAGAEINLAMNDVATPLYVASFNGHEKIVEYLKTVGADINRVTHGGFTPLYAASLKGHEKIVEYLTTVGADINRVANGGFTPLYVASLTGQEKIVEKLTTVGAEINRATDNGVTPLHVASFNGHEKVVEYLVTVGADINRADDNGQTSLHIASQKAHQGIVELLTKAGAQTN